MATSNEISLLAQFDDVFRGFNLDGCDSEFHDFAINQHECQQKWLVVEQEILRTQHLLNEASKSTSKLQLQNHHANMLLKEEVKIRSSMQEEKRLIEKQLEKVREYLAGDTDLKQETKEKLSLLSYGRYPHLAMNSHARAIDKLDTIKEINSNESFSAISENASNLSNQELDDLELSGTVRSYREVNRLNKRIIKTVQTKDEYSTVENAILCKNRATQMDVNREECLVATTKISVNLDGSTVATSTIETRPAPSVENSKLYTTKSHIKNHCYKRQTIIHQIENCLPCGLRIKFGKPALKCVECGRTCHLDCESRMPKSCLPKQDDPFSKNVSDVSSQKPKKLIRFFSSPSTKN